jgi:CheY-like chemotaxis protein
MHPRKRTILCIDDNWVGLISRKRFLEQKGYRVLEATNGDEGLELFLSHLIDAVVLDYQLPGMHADTLAARMKKAKPHIPILLLSAYGPLPEGKLASVDVFLTKSQEPLGLLSSLRVLLTAKPKPFFHRWFDSWRGRHHAARI